MDQRQIESVLQDSVQPLVRNSGTEENKAESESDYDEDDDDYTGESSDDDYDSESDGNDNNNDSSGLDPLAGLKTCSEYKTLLKDNFPADVVLASLIKCGSTRNLDELTEWCFGRHTDQEIQDILASYRKEQGGPRNIVPAPKQVVELLPTPPSQQMVQQITFVPSSGGALLSQQFASVWDEFLAEVESVAGADHLSFPVLAKGLEALAAQLEPLNRTFFSHIKTSCPNLVRIMMAIKINLDFFKGNLS